MPQIDKQKDGLINYLRKNDLIKCKMDLFNFLNVVSKYIPNGLNM